MRLLTLVFVGLSALLVAGCSGAPESVLPTPGPHIPGLKLSGKWYSQEFGDIRFVQDDIKVTGTYEDPRGPDHNGRFSGRVEGDVLWFDWVKPGNTVAAVFPMRGKGWARIGRDGTTLEGKWGYDTNHDNGGPFRAEKSQFQ